MEEARPLRRRVLIVEDNASVRQALNEVLEEAGYETDCAANGKEALERLHYEEPPGLILLDLMMPVMNGWVFRDQQLKDPALATIPVVLISMEAALAQWGVELKAAGCLEKPVDIDRLLIMVDSLCC